jgi:hypothetical protein
VLSLAQTHTTIQFNTHQVFSNSLWLHQSFPGSGFQNRSLLRFRVHPLTGQWLSPNWLNSRLVLIIKHRHGSRRKLSCCVTQLSHVLRREYLFPISPLMRVKNLLPSNGRCLQSHYLVTGLHTATVIRPVTGWKIKLGNAESQVIYRLSFNCILHIPCNNMRKWFQVISK